jgi:hypothetical protein
MKEYVTDCSRCKEKETLIRVPAITFIKTNATSTSTGQKVGALVEQHIQEAKEDLEQEKTDLRTTDYEGSK